jgi:hypothetical protein
LRHRLLTLRASGTVKIPGRNNFMNSCESACIADFRVVY